MDRGQTILGAFLLGLPYTTRLRPAAELLQLHIKLFPSFHKTDVMIRQRPYLDILRNIIGATVIDTIDAFCPKGDCMAFDDKGIPLYYDDDHLSQSGSIFQAECILKPYLTSTFLQ